MNHLKRILAVTLVLALVVVSFCGCHKKGEKAVKINDTDFTTGMYIAVLYQEAFIAINQIYSENSDLDTSKEGYYRNQKIDGKVFSDYVTEKVLETLKEIVAAEEYMKKNDIKLSDENETNIKESANAIWSVKVDYNDETDYSLGAYLEANGVSKDTFTTMFRATQLKNAIFDAVYGKEGKKAISDDEIKAYFNEKYLVINEASTTEYSSKTDEEKANIKAKYEECEKKVNDGSMTFEAAYAELVALETTGENASSASQTPQNAYLNEDNGDDYKTAKEMQNNTAKLITLDDDAGFRLIYKKDITADTEGATSYDSVIRQALKGDEYQKAFDDITKNLKVTKRKSALKAVKVKKIVFEDYMAIYQTAYNNLTGNSYNK